MLSVKFHGIFKSQNPKIFLFCNARGSRKTDWTNYISRYYHQRRSIFSRYDDGIWMTEDAWYGVTPEPVAKYASPPFSFYSLENFFLPPNFFLFLFLFFKKSFPPPARILTSSLPSRPFSHTGNLEKSQRNSSILHHQKR